ncbi:copper chaperone PCu(A)C [Noviherbaspirillum sedimenti]|uniref:Copper chaperone PCu(A)C n=1 Tax=Noviherbaspirillum sedimenti TaxID=2320865 RepID=A0A3A3GAC2_9BURK|nr:copper chaperone PCu(A)C [Noviherbaspirillum sedimenti]RJG03552.1 copper chaperone PCu(A)C [Noviherbaspirillum sedimenti]
MYLRFILAALIVVTAPLHARDYQAGKLFIEQPTARPTRPGQPGAAAYINIENRGSTADRLVGASSPVAGTTEIHVMTMNGNVMKMREVGEIAIDSGATVVMRPGEGYHIMLLNLKKPLKAGERFPLTLRFEKAGKVKVSVEISDQISGVNPHGNVAGGTGH